MTEIIPTWQETMDADPETDITHTFSTRNEFDPERVQEGDQINVIYDSKRSATPVAHKGFIDEIDDQRLVTMLKIRPYYKHEDTRYVSLFDDVSHIHSPHAERGCQTLSYPGENVECEVITSESS